jgi:hypothetical protein
VQIVSPQCAEQQLNLEDCSSNAEALHEKKEYQQVKLKVNTTVVYKTHNKFRPEIFYPKVMNIRTWGNSSNKQNLYCSMISCSISERQDALISTKLD